MLNLMKTLILAQILVLKKNLLIQNHNAKLDQNSHPSSDPDSDPGPDPSSDPCS